MPKNSFQTIYLYLLGHRDNLSLGNCFHYGRHGVKKDLSLAISYYLEAAQQNPIEAFDQLHILFNEEGCSSEADYYLGRKHECLSLWQDALTAYKQSGEAGYVFSFYRAGLLFKQDRLSTSASQIIKKDLATELSWYRKAAAAYSKHALDTLITLSTKEPKAALHLAQMYEQGEIGNKKSLITAVDYYEKASKMGDVIAAYRLGQLYEWGEEPFKLDPSKAFAHYLVAAKKQDKKALERLEMIVKKFNDPDSQLQLADIYENFFSKKELALKLLQDLADRDNKIALERMNSLANRDANCAYELAKSYENEVSNKENAYQYYVFAMQNNHSRASDDLTALAESGDSEAQYALGYLYYHSNKNFSKAIHWCLLAAAQQHDKAINYIKNTIFPSEYYLVLANNYEKGEKVNINKENALYFYEKALIEKNKEAAFFLGQYYQFDNEEKAFAYFIKAAQWGHTEALCYLERLATELDSTTQLQLANLYRDPPLNNSYKALYWSRQAIIASDDNTAFSDEVIVKLIEDTGKVISFENLNLLARKIAHEPKLTVPSSLLK
jgi:TPR repeat protein